ncbi:putative membrane protein YccC [Luteimonas cucumeris]|uniref:Putative membrane protein YccC n=1 Tax=Luteimonas cucumeris TaxID=985012 RepID=A0A562L7Y7_9GAMM|nr:FUSC family protein [Luteimonas cucumeris]TWI03760.1 putative membrane protein YccC [Luteimonas cucumeris]
MLRSLIALKPRDVPVRVALRNTVAVVAPLAVGIALDHTAAGLAMSTGALNTMFTDQPGPYRLRMQRMLLAAAAAGLSALTGILIGAHSLLFVFAALVFAFAGGMLVALGPMAARVGLTSMIVMMITAEMQVPRQYAAGVAALIFAGGLLQMLLAVAAWPLQRYRPERFALATVLRQLATVARTRPDASLAPPVSLAAMEALDLLHGEHRARGVAVQSFRIIAEICERVRADLLTLGDLHGRIEDTTARSGVETLLDHAAVILDHLGDAMADAEKPTQGEREAATFDIWVDALRQAPTDAMSRRDRRLQKVAIARAEGLAGQLRSLARNGHWASSRGEIRADMAEAHLPAALRPRDPLATLRANLKLSSVAFRHAIRCAICVALAVAGERWLRIPHGVWIPMTTAIVLKPDFGGTLRFGVLRVAGTFAGLLLATLLAHYAMDGVVLRLLLMAALCMAFRLLAQVNYALGVAMLTGMLVLLLSFRGMAPGEAVQARVIATLIGSALALVAYAAWPTWEGRRINESLAKLIDAHRAHIKALLAGAIDELYETRTAARAARTNVQASLERLRGEPRRLRSKPQIALAESLLANANRLIRAPLLLESLLRDGAALPDNPVLREFATEVDRVLAEIVSAVREGRNVTLPSLRPIERRLVESLARPDNGAEDAFAIALGDTCDRITDSIDTLAHVLRPPAREVNASTAAAG